MSTEVSKIYAQIPLFLDGNNEFNRLLRTFSGFLKLTVAWDKSILQSSFYMHYLSCIAINNCQMA